MPVMNSDKGPDKWWKRWRFLNVLYHPLLVATEKGYPRRGPRKKAPPEDPAQEQFAEAEKTISSYRKSASEFVGYKDLVDEILSSVHYWVFDDEEF